MADLASQLLDAARSGATAGVQACLAAGADANLQHSSFWAPLPCATFYGHTECVAALIAGGADVNVCTNDGYTPLHSAAMQNHADCVQLLLAAGADPLAATADDGYTPLHFAALNPACSVVVIPLLLQAGPAAALVTEFTHRTPLTVAIFYGQRDTTRCLLEQGPLPPAREVLAALASASAVMRPVYAILVSRQPLTAEEWEQVPASLPGLAAVLPAVLRRSAQEAALLVRHLPAAKQQRLRTAALCLARAQRLVGSLLPSPIVGLILSLSVAPL